MNRLASMILSRRWLALPPLAVGVAVVGALAQSKKPLDRVEEPLRSPVCEVITARISNHQAEAAGYGVANPVRRWSAVAEVSGRIVETHPRLRSGVAVAAGDTLVVIDRQDYTLRLKQRQAEFRQAKAELGELRVNEAADEASLAIQRELEFVRKSDVERLAPLRRDTTVTEYEYESAQAVYLQQRQSVQTLVNSLRSYEAKIASAEAAIALAEARATEAQRDVDRTWILAPFDGLLVSADLEQGQYVAAGQALFEVIDTSSVEVEAQFSIAEISRVLWSGGGLGAAGAAIEGALPNAVTPPQPLAGAQTLDMLKARAITNTSGSPRSYRARPLRLSSTVDERTRTIGVVVNVTNRRPASGPSWVHRPHLRAGTFCEVVLTAAAPAPVILLPRSAVADGAAMIVDGEDRLRRRELEIDYVFGDSVAVRSGVAAGERVAVNPPASSMDGQLVRPTEAAASRTEVSPVADHSADLRGDRKP